MGLSELLFGVPATLSDGSTEVILSPVMSEGESFSAEITRNAIEDGSNITDHVHPQPKNISIMAFLADKNDLMAVAASLIFGADKTVTEKLGWLKAWMEFGVPLIYSGPVFSGVIKKGYDIFAEDMVISSLDIMRTSENGSGVEVSIALQEIIIAQARMESISLPQAARPRANRGATPRGSASGSGGGRRSVMSRMFTS